jgi:hypothetical protein
MYYGSLSWAPAGKGPAEATDPGLHLPVVVLWSFAKAIFAVAT